MDQYVISNENKRALKMNNYVLQITQMLLSYSYGTVLGYII